MMTPGVIQIPGDVSVGEAARLMQKEQAPCVLIKDTASTVGIMTHTDIVYKVVAQGLNPDEVQARRVMSGPIQSVEFDLPVKDVATKLAASGAPLLVVTRHQQPIGIITARDLVLSPDQRGGSLQASVRVYDEKPEGVRHTAVITQISHLGAFVQSEATMEPGARITLELYFPSSKQPITVEATVMGPDDHAETGETRPTRPESGTAVRFMDLSEADQSRISEWILRNRPQHPGAL